MAGLTVSSFVSYLMNSGLSSLRRQVTSFPAQSVSLETTRGARAGGESPTGCVVHKGWSELIVAGKSNGNTVTVFVKCIPTKQRFQVRLYHWNHASTGLVWTLTTNYDEVSTPSTRA